jgi:hypothetical protein
LGGFLERNLMKAIIITLLSCISFIAQEPTNFRQKYNAPLSETYLVRSGIYVTVTYAKSGEVCEMLISSKSPAEYLNGRSRRNIRSEVLTGIIDEIVPMS